MRETTVELVSAEVSPEELVTNGWVEDGGPYVRLSHDAPAPDAWEGGVAHYIASPQPDRARD